MRSKPSSGAGGCLAGRDGAEVLRWRTDSTKPVVCLSTRPNRLLSVTQNWMAASENYGLRPRLPLPSANQAMRLCSQMDNEPRALSAALYCFQLVVR